MDFLPENQAVRTAALIFHLLMAVALWKMAEKAEEEPKWYALVPILNAVLFMRLAKRPAWWVVLLFVPLVNIAVIALSSMALCERFGLKRWWGLLSLISPANLILYLYLGLGPPRPAAAPPGSPPVVHDLDAS
jgi:signal peptidase I